MQHILVHIDAGLGPIGAWGFTGETLTHFYPESLDLAISSRAREAMAQRDPSTSVPDWFAYLSEHRNSLVDQYETLAIDKPVALPFILAEFRRSWNTNAESA